MWLSVCGDPECPNKARVEELEEEVARLKTLMVQAKAVMELEDEVRSLRRQLAQAQEDNKGYRPRFRYPE